MDTALFTHHHYGWRKHDLPNSHYDHLVSALLATHGFLNEYEGDFRIDVERTPACSFDGRVNVYWDTDKPKALIGQSSLRRGDFWFRAFEFNVGEDNACGFCGGTGMDHYKGPFFHCWACDGLAKPIRSSTFRGFMNRPTEHAAADTHAQYSNYLAARGQP